MSGNDFVRVNDLSIHASVLDFYQSAILQPLLVSVSIPSDLSLPGALDDLSHSLDYSSLCACIQRTAAGKESNKKGEKVWNSIEELAEQLLVSLLRTFPRSASGSGICSMTLNVQLIRRIMNCRGAGVEVFRRGLAKTSLTSAFLRDLEVDTIIGVRPRERNLKQKVVLNVSLTPNREYMSWGFDFGGFASHVYNAVSNSSYLTLEALASNVACTSLQFAGKSPAWTANGHVSAVGPFVNSVTVRISKPNALVFASSPEIEVTRSPSDFPGDFSSHPYGHGINDLHVSLTEGSQIAAIALGSNIGNRHQNIEHALRRLSSHVNGPSAVRVIDTSFLYESHPMYVENQPRFFNCVCLVDTTLDPHELLSHVKQIEADVGRIPSFKNGPRVVDLDILFWGDEFINHHSAMGAQADLHIPHPRISEREFVLRPLSDLVPDYIHPRLGSSVRALLESLMDGQPSTLRKVAPVSGHDSEPSSRTRIMSTINVTPDSFSDGGVHNLVQDAVNYALSGVKVGADIIDIGGYSTRPGASYVTPSEEISRVVPVIELLRGKLSPSTLISVDTFRGTVADAAIKAGADIINDVRALGGDPDEPEGASILDVAVRTGVPVIMMHSRGDDAGKNNILDSIPAGASTVSGIDAVVNVVRDELGAKVAKAIRAGVRRWNIVVDPGIGFSKGGQVGEGNIRIIRNLKQLTIPSPEPKTPLPANTRLSTALRASPMTDLPVLVGTSKKSFLGKIMPKDPENGQVRPAKERGWATAAAITSAIQQGCNIVRVHDVAEMKDVVAVADAIWRSH